MKLKNITCYMRQEATAEGESEKFDIDMNLKFEFSDYGTTVVD